MSLRFTDSQAYCNFVTTSLKYLTAHNPIAAPMYVAGSGFWNPASPVGGPGWSSGVDTITIDSGPYPGTASVHLKDANPIWYRQAYMGPTRGNDWIVAMWIYPINIVGVKTFLLMQENTATPNFGTIFGMQIRDDHKIVLNPQPNNNANFFPALFDQPSFFPHWPTPTSGPAFAVSNANIPINSIPPTPGSARGWTHVCLQVHFDPSGGFLKLWINGCLDLHGTLLNLPVGSNLITQTWSSTDGSELCVSQFVIQDTAGSMNNSNVSQFATIQTIFPSSDVVTGWSGGFNLVNGNPGPTGPGINLTTLATPDELFGFPAGSPIAQVLGVSLNMALTAPTQSVDGLYKVGSHIASPITPTLTALLSGQWTRQAITEMNPWTGLPWTIADINSTAWGMRGVSGVGTNCAQFFIEVLGQSGPPVCGGGSYATGQT